MNYLRFLVLVFSLAVVVATTTGCCSVKRKKIKENKSSTRKINTTSNGNKYTKTKYNKRSRFKSSQKKRTSEQKKLARLYSGLEQASNMMEKKNNEGALRAVKRIQNSVINNPYIEMQAWYLSVQIYDKMGKRSSRKRSMRKMFEAMKSLRKHPEYQKSCKTGLANQNVIKTAIKQGKGKYEY